ncbi:hypothetical protein, partial [Leeuwenhoekiella sp. UBA1003]|uniref:hypothetical protein n=1 Tax=Leeuwenhoekiella sp. UBA1003 TaxID=1946744 RepID=UPI0025BFBF74
LDTIFSNSGSQKSLELTILNTFNFGSRLQANTRFSTALKVTFFVNPFLSCGTLGSDKYEISQQSQYAVGSPFEKA